MESVGPTWVGNPPRSPLWLMALTRELNELACRFARSADIGRSLAMRDLERSLCVCDYGSTGNATRQEVERIAELLDLRPGARLLDVGAGSGWPGLYLAQLTGCELVVVDIPLASLGIALERAAADGQSARCRVVAADAAALPFKDGAFDALNHTDLLCCTPDKLGVLRACRRVARDGARTVFTAIAPAPTLTEPERLLPSRRDRSLRTPRVTTRSCWIEQDGTFSTEWI
jgi:SAM-dependent methyltransferase